MTYSEKQKLENTYNSDSTEDRYQNTLMNSYTQSFKVYLEYTDNDGGDNVTDDVEQVNIIDNIDFGIIERAKQGLQLDKHITAVKVTLSNGNVLINAKLEDGQLVDQVQHVSVTPVSPGANGMVRIEIDQELIQAATLEVEYNLEVTNISELDYATQDFYMYGVGYGDENINNIVTLRPALIIDYLDNNLTIDINENLAWHYIESDNREEELIDTGLLSENLEDTLDNTTRIIATDNLEGESLVPVGLEKTNIGSKSTVDVALKGNRLLSSTDETFLENNAEIIKVIKNGGAVIITTPGNYVPTDSSTSESDNSTAEDIVILPPTGLTTNYIAYILLAISSLGILVAGVILIKKFVIK